MPPKRKGDKSEVSDAPGASESIGPNVTFSAADTVEVATDNGSPTKKAKVTWSRAKAIKMESIPAATTETSPADLATADASPTSMSDTTTHINIAPISAIDATPDASATPVDTVSEDTTTKDASTSDATIISAKVHQDSPEASSVPAPVTPIKKPSADTAKVTATPASKILPALDALDLAPSFPELPPGDLADPSSQKSQAVAADKMPACQIKIDATAPYMIDPLVTYPNLLASVPGIEVRTNDYMSDKCTLSAMHLSTWIKSSGGVETPTVRQVEAALNFVSAVAPEGFTRVYNGARCDLSSIRLDRDNRLVGPAVSPAGARPNTTFVSVGIVESSFLIQGKPVKGYHIRCLSIVMHQPDLMFLLQNIGNKLDLPIVEARNSVMHNHTLTLSLQREFLNNNRRNLSSFLGNDASATPRGGGLFARTAYIRHEYIVPVFDGRVSPSNPNGFMSTDADWASFTSLPKLVDYQGANAEQKELLPCTPVIVGYTAGKYQRDEGGCLTTNLKFVIVIGEDDDE